MMGHCDTRVNTETDRHLWNVAADCVTEAIATQCNIGQGDYCEGVISPTNNGTVNLNINGSKLIISYCQDKSVEEIYNILKNHADKNKNKDGKIHILDENGKVVGSFDAHGLREFTPEEKNDLEQELRHALVEHKLKGTMPGGLADMLEKMLKGKVNWRAELRDAIVPEIKAYQSYYRPHKKGMAEGLILPVMRKEGVNVHIAGDTSGSIGKNELDYFTGEITHLFNQFDPGIVTGTLMLHHTEVYQTIKLDDVKDLDKIQTESGGTSHLDVFAKAEEDDANVLILLTDGMSEFPEYTKIKKVLWICTNEAGMERIPSNLGKKIFIDIKDLQEE
jgi:predicted metal-dependent peptidase